MNNQTTTEGRILEICQSLYQTGLNNGKNHIKHLPTPVGYRVDQIMQLIQQEKKAALEEVIEELKYIITYSHMSDDYKRGLRDGASIATEKLQALAKEIEK